MEQEPRSGCPINIAVEAFGDSWSLLVLRDVMFGNRRYFRELLAGSEERIASNILADRLKRLVSAGLLTREDAGPGRRAAYSLTEASIQLVPVFAQLGEWGLRHRPTTKRLRVRAELLAGSEEGIASNILADRLKRLVSAGLLTREDAGPGRRAAYSLTEASIQLVPVFAQLGEWGLHHRPTTKRLRVRAELLADGGSELWREFMAELRTIHLGEPAPERDGPSVMERLADAYAAAL